MQLSNYLDEHGKSQAGFGAELDPPASQSLVNQWLRGVTRITLAYALEIERKTKGQVTPQDCADMYARPIPERPRSIQVPA